MKKVIQKRKRILNEEHSKAKVAMRNMARLARNQAAPSDTATAHIDEKRSILGLFRRRVFG